MPAKKKATRADVQNPPEEGRPGEGDRRPRQGQDRTRDLGVIAERGKVLVEGVSMIKRHTRPNPPSRSRAASPSAKAPSRFRT